jgi:glycine dehydrogenase subunit 1
MNLLPFSDEDRDRLRQAIGCHEDELLAAAPPAEFKPFPAKTETEILDRLRPLAVPLEASRSGLGIGAYPIPAVVDALASRGEFVTAYTPYQPECSQGTLASIFEFQTRICELTGLDLANAGVYDGATALVEAVRMAVAETGRREIVVSRAVLPSWREVLVTHFAGIDLAFREAAFDPESGRTVDPRALLSERTAALVLASPNALGVIEDETAVFFAAARAAGAIPIQVFHPIAVAILPTPAEVGAEIAVAEGQPLGIPLSAGGPYLGIMAATSRFMRRLPGRIAGCTTDADGRPAFVLTLQTREQHIRRERATSNICSNQALMALRAVIRLAAFGRDGLADEARRLNEKALAVSEGRRLFSGRIFNEWVTEEADGLRLDYPELGPATLKAVVR